MIRRLTHALLFSILFSFLSGCLYRGEGIFKRIEDTDYKARLTFQNMLAVGEGGLTGVSGVVLREDHVTPLGNIPVHLIRKNQHIVVSSTQTDNVGRFFITGILYNEPYVVEVESPNYSGSKEIKVSLNRVNNHEIYVEKR